MVDMWQEYRIYSNIFATLVSTPNRLRSNGMRDSESWDWQARKRVVTKLADVLGGFSRVNELAVSPDGETLAAVGKTPDDDFAVCLNGKEWPDKYELAWYLRYSPSGNLIVLARIEDEWTVVNNGVS